MSNIILTSLSTAREFERGKIGVGYTEHAFLNTRLYYKTQEATRILQRRWMSQEGIGLASY